MSQSFEKKVGSRLQHYEPSPPAHLKSKVFDAVNPSKGLNGWQVTGVILFVLSFFFWMQAAMPGSERLTEDKVMAIPVETNETENEQNLKVANLDTDLGNKRESESNAINVPLTTKQKSVRSQRSVSTHANADQSTNGGAGAIAEGFERDALLTWEVDERSPHFDPNFGIGGLALRPARRETIGFTKEVVAPKKQFPMYVESGLFFLYQQAFPNMEDQLVISDFSGESGFSPKRISAYVEGGVYFRPFPKMRVHLGGKLNTFQQSYQFAIRGFAADSVQIIQTGDEVVFNPIYDQDKVKIDHRLFGAGLKASINWNVFPSYTNELVSSIEYLSVLNGRQSFQYDNRSYTVGYSDQLLLSIGMRKILIENEKGMLQVHPSLRYSLNQVNPSRGEVLSMKPYSVGISFSYIFGNFRR